MLSKLFFLLIPALAVAQPAATDLYHIVFLRPDPVRKPLSKEEGSRIQAAHMANIHSMADRGILVAAGPFEDKKPTISGVFFFKTESIEEARRIASEDPTVVEHRNTVDVFAWRGPAHIGEEYKRLHKADPQTPEGMGVHPFYMLLRAKDSKQSMTDHDTYVAGLVKKGKLVAAGPASGNGMVSEILIFNRIPDEEAAALAAEDPAVKTGLLTVEPHRWWCSAHVLPQ